LFAACDDRFEVIPMRLPRRFPTGSTLVLLVCGCAAGCGDSRESDDHTVTPPAATAGVPAIRRGEAYMGTPERFNRYYTEPSWQPARTVYVSPNGGGSGATRDDPAAVGSAMNDARPGDRIVFTRSSSAYSGCYELDEAHSGTYDAPIVLYAERNGDGSRGVEIDCCGSGRRTCINLEGANYVAVDGFELRGGRYGVRAVGLSFTSTEHQKGVAVLNCHGHDQSNDPFLTGQSDWYVIEGSLAHNGGSGDGHGVYLSNGSDWNIARFNKLWLNGSSDFQINADPGMTCADEGIRYDDPRCDGSARDGQGQGVSEFMLIDSNYFHNGLAQGANFTSVRNSVVRNNIFAFYARHGVSFWQETDNPRLGSGNNLVHHNLFIGKNNRELCQITDHSDGNDVRNNVFIGLAISGRTATANSGTQLLNLDGTMPNTVFKNNYYIAGTMNGHVPGSDEWTRSDLDPAWFASFPFDLMGTAQDFTPSASAPFRNLGALLPDTPYDRNGTARHAPVDLGPIEVP
jgi:hypothetical protein